MSAEPLVEHRGGMHTNDPALVACESAVATSTGEPFSYSPFGFGYFAPSEWTCMQGDRGLFCVATTLNEDWTEEIETTGSIAQDADLLAQSEQGGTVSEAASGAGIGAVAQRAAGRWRRGATAQAWDPGPVSSSLS